MSIIPTKKILNSSVISIFIFLAFLVAVNFFVSQNSVYFDLTDGKIYTTSQVTRNILKNLKNEVDVNFYISKDLPQNVAGTKTQLIDFMNQYKDIARSKLKVSYIEPENTSQKVKELATKGIPQIQFNVVEKDKYEVKQGFFGVEITSKHNGKTRKEAIPIIKSIDNWEYDFISAVYSVSNDNKVGVAFLKGHGEKDIQTQDLEKSYKIMNVKIETKGDKKGFFVSEDKTGENTKSEQVKKEKEFVTPATLIIIAPVTKISSDEISVLNDFIMHGGNVIVASENVIPDLQNNLKARIVDNNLNEFTKKYGIQIDSDLIYDESNSNITYRQGFFSVSKAYPFFVKAIQNNFGKYPSFSGIQSIMFPWVSSLSISENKDYLAKPLISSTNQAKSMSGSYNLLPNNLFSFAGGSKKTIVAFARSKDKNLKEGTLFVIGDSDFISSNFSNQDSDNKTFFMNLVDSVSSSVNLASIRSKNIVDRPLKDIPESKKNYWKFISIFGGAILLDIYGIFRIMKRKKKSK